MTQLSGTDHTREYVPLLAYSKNDKTRRLPQGFYSDISATIAENFEVLQRKTVKAFKSITIIRGGNT